MEAAFKALDHGGVPLVLVIVGLVLVVAGIVGSINWTGKFQYTMKAWQRVVFAVFGLVSTATAIHLYVPSREAGASALPPEFETRIKDLEAKSAAAGPANASLEREVQDSLTVAIDAMVSVSGQPTQTPCGETRLYAKFRPWNKSTTSICQRIENSFLPIAVTVQIADPALQGHLIQELSALGTPVRYTPGSSGLAEQELGILFADDVPRELICEVRQTFLAVTHTPLRFAASTTQFSVKTAGITGPAFGIQVGVWFGQFFELKGTELDEPTWTKICGANYKSDSFLDFVNHHDESLVAKAPSKKT